MTATQEIEASDNKVPTVEPPNSIYGVRHTQTILLFILVTIGYGMRVNLFVGIVAMTDPTINPNITTYDWTNLNAIISSFYWGYVLTQILAGQLAEAYGAKWFLVLTMSVSSVCSILIPVMAQFGSWGVIGCRIVQGLAQGFFFASCHTLMSKWYPPNERTRLSVFVYAGSSFGTFVSLVVTGWISSSIGWPYAFYTYGIAGCLWVVAWIFLGSNSPAEHPSIDPKEKEYIQASLGQTEIKAPPPTPWGSIVTSLPAWAVLLAHCGQNWGFTTLLTNTPTYTSKVLGLDIEKNGYLSAGPYFVFWALSFVFSYATDYVIKNDIVSTGVARKVTNSIGLYVPAAALLTLGLISTAEDKDTTDVTIALLFIAVGINSCSYCGYHVNHIDLSPNHAGTLMGITSGFSNVTAIIAPLVIGVIVTDTTDAGQWAIIFYIASAVYVVGNTFFVIFGSGEIQPWDEIVEKS